MYVMQACVSLPHTSPFNLLHHHHAQAMAGLGTDERAMIQVCASVDLCGVMVFLAMDKCVCKALVLVGKPHNLEPKVYKKEVQICL